MSLILKHPDIQAIIANQAQGVPINFTPLVEHTARWRIYYQIQCALFIAKAKQSDTDAKVIQELAKDTLFLAKTLEALYCELNETTLAAEFNHDKIYLQKVLNELSDKRVHSGSSFPRAVQAFTFHVDTTRQLVNQSRRGCIALSSFPETFGAQFKAVTPILDAAAPTLSILGFLIYLPRNIVSAFVLIKRAFETQNIPLATRMRVHCEVDNRLYNMVNDFPTVATAFVALFVLTPSTLFIAAYFALIVKTCEVLMSAAKTYYDNKTLFDLRAEYIDAMQKNDFSEEDRAFLQQLDKYIEYETKEAYLLTIAHFMLLLCFTAFIPPVLMITPWVPITAACIAFGVVFLRLPEFRGLFLPPKPETSLSSLSSHGFFSQKEDNTLPDTDAYTIDETIEPIKLKTT